MGTSWVGEFPPCMALSLAHSCKGSFRHGGGGAEMPWQR